MILGIISNLIPLHGTYDSSGSGSEEDFLFRSIPNGSGEMPSEISR